MDRLAAIFDAIEDAVVVTDRDGRVVAWNAGAERLYGLARDRVLGQVFAELIPEVGAITSQPRRTRELATGLAWSGRIVQHTPDGRHLEVDVVMRAITSDAGDIEERVAVYRPDDLLGDLLDRDPRAGFLRKPFDVVTLAGQVREVLTADGA